MIVREWRSEFDSSRSNEFERLETESLHILNRQPGFVSVLFSRNGPNIAVTLSVWENQNAIDALKNSSGYFDFMKMLQDSGMLRGAPTEELFEIKGGYLPSGVDHKFYAKDRSSVSIPEGVLKANG